MQRLSFSDAAELELHPAFVSALQSQPDTRCEVTASWPWVCPLPHWLFPHISPGTTTPVTSVGLTWHHFAFDTHQVHGLLPLMHVSNGIFTCRMSK